MPLYKIENDLKRDVVKITPGCKPINICIFLKQIAGNNPHCEGSDDEEIALIKFSSVKLQP